MQRPQIAVDEAIDLDKYKPSKKHKKEHTNKRKVKVDKIENVERLVITQKVEVKKQKFKCIINLTNICEHKKKHPKNKEKRSTKIKEKLLQKKDKKITIKKDEKITIKKDEKINEKLPIKKVEKKSIKNEKPKNEPKKSATKETTRTTNNKCFSLTSGKDRIVPKCDRYQCTKHLRSKPVKSFKQEEYKRKSPKCEWGSLSPLSIISVESSPKLYEDISSDSFYSDEEIDCLIKRTKDRERKMSWSFEGQPLLTASTPYYENISDAETILSKNSGLDTSLHSTTTLVLQPKIGLYSPSYPTSPNEKAYKPEKQSNASNTKITKYSAGFDIQPTNSLERSCNIKNEPYSPSESPVCVSSKQTKYSTGLNVEPTPSSIQRSHVKNEPYSPSESHICNFEPEKYPYEVPIKSENIKPVHTHSSEAEIANTTTNRKTDENFNIFSVKPVRDSQGLIMSKNNQVYTKNNNVLIKSEYPEID